MATIENIQIISGTPAVNEYLEAILELESASFSPPWKRADFLGELDQAGSIGMVLLSGERFAGYLFAQQVPGEAGINKICIHPSFRRRGYGRVLVTRMCETAEAGVRRIFLEVAAVNAAAIGLYTSCGFRVNRIRKKIYANGDDALEMVLDR
jgi:ribosomal-protein-alanine N-acetyltransferase